MEEKMKANGSWCNTMATTFYPLLGLCFSGVVVWTYLDYPLKPLQLEDTDWGQQWLLTLVIDYYTLALCIVGVLFATEHCCIAGVWSLLILGLGAPFACAYMVVRVCRHGNLSLLTMKDERFITPRGTDSGPIRGYFSGFYVVAGLSFAARLGWTLLHYPLLPLQDDSKWLTEWLLTTAGDIVTIAACLCGIVCSTEGAFMSVVWCLAVLLTGGSGGCAYLTYRACLHDSITLQSKPRWSPNLTPEPDVPLVNRQVYYDRSMTG